MARIQYDELQWLTSEREKAAAEVRKCKQRIVDTYSDIVRPTPVPETPMGKLLYYVERGFTVYRGMRIGLQIGEAISLFLKLRKSFGGRKRK